MATSGSDFIPISPASPTQSDRPADLSIPYNHRYWQPIVQLTRSRSPLRHQPAFTNMQTPRSPSPPITSTIEDDEVEILFDPYRAGTAQLREGMHLQRATFDLRQKLVYGGKRPTLRKIHATTLVKGYNQIPLGWTDR
jgi:hypothetical protein